MDICPNCKSKLTIDEKSSGTCLSCGANFPCETTSLDSSHETSVKSVLSEDNKQCNDQANSNSIAIAIKTCGIMIIILGTVSSFIIVNSSYRFSLIQFLIPETISIISGLIFLGFSEIIQLLEDIKNKLK